MTDGRPPAKKVAAKHAAEAHRILTEHKPVPLYLAQAQAHALTALAIAQAGLPADHPENQAEPMRGEVKS